MPEPLATLPNRSNESSVTLRTGLLHCHGSHRNLGLAYPLSDEDEFFTEKNTFNRLQHCVFLPPPPPQKIAPPIRTTVGDIGIEQLVTHLQGGREILAPEVTKENLSTAILELNSIISNCNSDGLNWGNDDEAIIRGARFIDGYAQNVKRAIVQFRDNSPFGESYRYLALAEKYRDLALHLPRMTEVRDFVAQNQRPLAETLIEAVENHYITGIGEVHSMSELGNTIRDTMPKLAERARERGEEVLLAVEIHPRYQEAINGLDYSQPTNVLVRRISEITGLAPSWAGNTANVIIGAKRSGIHVICVDQLHGATGEQRPTTQQRNERDRAMYEAIVSYIHIPEWIGNNVTDARIPGLRISGLGLRGLADERLYNPRPARRVIFYGGGYHTSQTSTTTDGNEGVPLFTLLSRRYGSSVTSFRTLNNLYGFDGNYLGRPSVETTMKAFSEGVRVIPNTGIIRNSSGYNYVIIDNSDFDVAAHLFRN